MKGMIFSGIQTVGLAVANAAELSSATGSIACNKIQLNRIPKNVQRHLIGFLLALKYKPSIVVD
jgi:hypothetical protein